MDLSTVINIDRQVLEFFNGSDSLFLDSLMVTLTSGATWVPLYVALLYLVIKNNDTMAQIALAVGCCLLCFFITEFVNEGIVKPMVARPRPGNDPQFMYLVDVVNERRGGKFSFFSAHASNTFGVAVFFCWLVRNKLLSWLMITWSLLNCYTRLYLGMHYPSDILVGLLFGAATASLAYLIYFLAFRTMKTKTSFVSSQFTKTGYSLNDIDVVAWVLAASYCLAIIIALIHQS